MTLMQLRYFCAVDKYGTVTKAAEKLHISQPSLSNAIKDLEGYLGVQLFTRERNKLYLTQVGEKFLEGAYKLVEEAKALENLVSSFSVISSPMNIGIPPMIGGLLFADFFVGFSAQYPQASFDLMEKGSGELVEMLMDETLDIAIIIEEAVNISNLQCITLMESEIELCLAQTHPLSQMESVSYHDIGLMPIVLMSQGSYQYNKIKEGFKKECVEPNIILTTNQITTMKNLVIQNGAGGFVFKGISIENDQGIKTVPLKEKIGFSINLAWKKGRSFSKEYMELIEFSEHYI